MSYRLIALDLDGTLLNSRKELTPETVEAVRSACAAGLSCSAAVKGRIAELIVELPLLRITQDRVSFSDVLKFLFGVLVSRICVRMILLGQFPVCGLKFLIVCCALDSKHPV